MEYIFEELPNRVQAALKDIEHGPNKETEEWLKSPIPALGDKSIIDTLQSYEDGEARVVAYCMAVKGKFF